MSYNQIALAIHHDALDQFTSQELITCLAAADGLYHNSDESFLEDDEYDALRRYAEVLEPHSVYFTKKSSSHITTKL